MRAGSSMKPKGCECTTFIWVILPGPLPVWWADRLSPYNDEMFELTVESVFSAAHAIVVQGVMEQVHGHDWHVTACLQGEKLDKDGLLVDFHAVERALNQIVAPFRNANLNETAPFDRVNPSAENVAVHIGSRLATDLEPIFRGAEGQATKVRVAWVRVTEAPGCAITYRLD